MIARHIVRSPTERATLCGVPMTYGTHFSVVRPHSAGEPGHLGPWCPSCLAIHGGALGPTPTAADDRAEHVMPEAPTVADVDRLLGQLQRDRTTAYWSDRSSQLDGVQAWLESLRDWLPA